MKLKLILLLLWALLAAPSAFAVAAPLSDGTVVADEPWRMEEPDYEAWLVKDVAWNKDAPQDPDVPVSTLRAYYTPQVFAALRDQTDVEARQVTYVSGGLKVRGFVVRPRGAKGKLPVVIWCRGGNRDFGAIEQETMLNMSRWARRGYLVLASNYRGAPGSEGRDEFGGADVNDVLALIPLARARGDADLDNLFLYGRSRGGMMVYRAMAEGLKVRAAAVMGGQTDLVRALADRPNMIGMYGEVMPDFKAEKASGYCRRSVVCWPEKISAPLLLVHGGADWRVKPAQSLNLAGKLEALGKPYSLYVAEGEDHHLLGRLHEVEEMVFAYFADHRSEASRD